MDGATCCTGWIWCCSGEVSGEPLDSDDRSEEAEWMECSCRNETLESAVPQVTLSVSRTIFVKGDGGGLSRRSSSQQTYIVLCQETRTELEVIIQIEGPTRFKPRAERRHCRSFGQLPHALHPPELAGILSHLGSPARATVVVVVVVVVI